VALAVASAAGAASALLLRAWSHGDTKREEREVHEQLTLAELHRMIASLASSRSGREVAQAAVRDVAPLVDAAIVRMWTIVSGERLELVGEYVDPDFAPTELTALSLAD